MPIAERVAGTALLLCFGAACANAQQHAFSQFSTKDGLAQSQVRTIAQDGQGYIWFGTLGGASRFDGRQFMNYALSDGLPDPQVSAMVRDGDGTLFLGCGNSLVRSSGHGLTVERLPAKSLGTRILALARNHRGSIFIGTDGGGVFVRDSAGIGPLSGYPADTASNVRALLALSDGRLLIGLRNGLLLWENGVCRSVQVGDTDPKAINALAESKDGTWWVGTVIDGLYGIHTDGKQTEYDEENGLLRNNVRCLLLDERDRLWIGTKFGVNLLDNGRLRLFTIHQGMPSDNISCAFQDSEGNVWFGTDGAGVLKYAGDRFVTFTLKDGLCSDLVMNITADAQGDLWLGTYDNGICRMDGMAWVSTLDGLPNNTIWCGARDRNGVLWFGTASGLVQLVNGMVRPLPPAIALADQPVLSLNEAPDGSMWCGLREGLAIISPLGEMELIPAAANGPGRSIRNMIRDRSGDLWLATEQGLVRYGKNRFTRFTKERGLGDNTVLCLLHDDKERLWIGTANGITCMENGTFHSFKLATDFGSNYVDLLLADGLGRIWAGTNNGLFLMHPDSLLDGRGSPEHITLNDGLRSLEFNLNAGFLDPRGRLMMGSAGGLVFHDLKRYPSSIPVPRPLTRITGVRSFLQATDWSDQSTGTDAQGLPTGLHLAYRRNHLTFDYVGISLSEPDQVQYRYRLKGFDQDWLPPTDARFASYSNLAQGTYSFEVTSSVRNGEWSAPTSFTFVITPPFWLRWWFFLACALVLSGAIYGVFRYRAMARQRHERTRQLMLRSRMLQLEQQALNANMNRHFVFNALNSIQYHINKQDRATASRYLTSFAKLIRKNLDASQNDTTTLAEELERLELYLVLEHMRFKDKFDYKITVEPGVDIAGARLPAMMLQPYVENSIWHGILPKDGSGRVEIVVRPAPNHRVQVHIQDDGIGMQNSLKAKEGLSGDHISRGIEITKGRADVLRKLELTDIRISGPEDRLDGASGRCLGTQVSIELPLTDGWKKSEGGLQTADGQLTFDGR
ncbi:MAG TPA: two-component regulator propeller domain-containing protein [Flavobacteriales bacterium]|nr:two-component regulator propeller domain-containing protein [Flavobacteriales bacterium]